MPPAAMPPPLPVPAPQELLRFFPADGSAEAAAYSHSGAAARAAAAAPAGSARVKPLRGEDLFADENHCVVRYWIGWSVSHGVAFANWRANEDSRFAQAQGHALAFFSKAHFRRDAFMHARLAFGVSIFPVVSNARYKDRIPDDVARGIRRAWRAFVPEDSDAHTLVPRLYQPDTAWVAALTAGGSVRLLKMRGDATEVWYLMVASGLPRALEAEVRAAMALWQGGLPNLGNTRTTFSSVASASATAAGTAPRAYEDVAHHEFARLIKLSSENRARIACAAAALAGFSFVDTTKGLETKHPEVVLDYTSRAHAGDAPPWSRELTPGSAQERAAIENALAAFSALQISASARVPIWYRDPASKFALGEALMHESVRQACQCDEPETCAYAVPAFVETTWNVLVPAEPAMGAPSGTGAVWMSECAPAWDPKHHSVVVFDDPVAADVCVLNWRAGVPASASVVQRHAVNCATLGAFPCVVPREDRARDIDEKDAGLSVELQKHFTRAAAARETNHPMVMGAWLTRTHADGTPAEAWQFAAPRAVFGTELAMHAQRAYDGSQTFPTPREQEFDASASSMDS